MFYPQLELHDITFISMGFEVYLEMLKVGPEHDNELN